MRTGIITVPKGILYENVTQESWGLLGTSVSDELLSGWAVGILDETEDWFKIVTHYGYQGWLKKQNLKEVPQKYLAYRDSHKKTSLISRPAIDVMETPRVQSRILQTLFQGSIVSLEEESEKGYRKIRTADGTEGYVPFIALSERRDSDRFLYPFDTPDCFLHQPALLHTPEPLLRKSVTAYAFSYLHTQYRWGGKTAEGIDCSGLTFMSWLMCGILIYRDAVIKEGYPVHEIPLSEIKPADLLYFPGHIGLYLGDRKYIHSTGNPKSFGCVINSLSPEAPDYRADLAESLTAVGSVLRR